MKNITINPNEEARIVIKNPDGKDVAINICMMQMSDTAFYRDIYVNRILPDYEQNICCIEVSEKDDFEVSVAADENLEEWTDRFYIKASPEEEDDGKFAVAPYPTTPDPVSVNLHGYDSAVNCYEECNDFIDLLVYCDEADVERVCKAFDKGLNDFYNDDDCTLCWGDAIENELAGIDCLVDYATLEDDGMTPDAEWKRLIGDVAVAAKVFRSHCFGD